MRHELTIALLGLCFAVLACAADVTPEEYLESQIKPVFRPGHTLPPLTYSGWGTENSNTVVELATHWGHAAHIGAAVIRTATVLLSNSQYQAYGIAQLVNAQPNTYKGSIALMKTFNIDAYIPPAYTNDDIDTGGFFSKSYFTTNASGQFLNGQGNVTTNAAVVSPFAPDADWQKATDCQVEMLRMINSNVFLSVIINDGEWGMYEYDSVWRAWHKDPRFVDEMALLGVTIVPDVYNAAPVLHHWIAQRKGRELSFLARTIATNFPNALYYWYKTDMEKYRLYGRVAGTDYGTNYVNGSNFDSRYTVTNFTFPTCESYYRSANSGLTNNYNGYGIIIGSTSQLLQFENWTGFMVSQGRPLSYNYVSAGWYRTALTNDSYIPHSQFMGLLKCFYTLGMIGGNAGNYETYSTNFNNPFPPNNPPQWLTQKIALAYVHAQFSWLDDYLRNGSMVAGPYTNLLSTDHMSYDFNQGTNGANNAHVFVRKMNASNNWLVTAWSDLTNQTLNVSIPILGEVTVTATDSGNVYTGGTNGLTLWDWPNAITIGTANINTLIIGP